MKDLLKPIGKGSVVDIVVEQIKSLILNGEIGPGDKIPTEIELMEQLDVGRNSVREAIKMLTALGILEVKRGQGTYVATTVKPSFFDPFIFSMMIEPRTNKELYEFRLMYDTMVGITAMNNGTEEEFAALEQNVATMESAYAASEHLDNMDYYAQMDIDFHRLLLDATHNPLIIRMGEAILGLFSKYIKKSISQKGGIERSIRNHRNILMTLKDKDSSHVVQDIDSTLAEWKSNWED